MQNPVVVRPIRPDDFQAWKPLWDGYNAFYGRKDETALSAEITGITWQRFFDPSEPVFALVAESAGSLLGLTHYLFHRSTSRIESTCYLQDLFTVQGERGRGIGKSFINAVYEAAQEAGVKRVYWQTHETNVAGRKLYDKVAKHLGLNWRATEQRRLTQYCCFKRICLLRSRMTRGVALGVVGAGESASEVLQSPPRCRRAPWWVPFGRAARTACCVS